MCLPEQICDLIFSYFLQLFQNGVILKLFYICKLIMIRVPISVVFCLFVKRSDDYQINSGNQLSRKEGRKEGNVLFNDALNTFYLRLYGVRHMVKDHSDSERGNLLLPHRLLFPISSKGSFICTIAQTG